MLIPKMCLILRRKSTPRNIQQNPYLAFVTDPVAAWRKIVCELLQFNVPINKDEQRNYNAVCILATMYARKVRALVIIARSRQVDQHIAVARSMGLIHQTDGQREMR